MQDKTTIKFLPWFGIPKLWPYFRAYKKEMVIMFVTAAISTLFESVKAPSLTDKFRNQD